MTGNREQEAGSRELCKCNSIFRHCEPPLQGWRELLRQNKGAWQPAFILLSWVQAKRQTADCFASLAMTNSRSVTASPRYTNGRRHLDPKKGARQSAFILLSWVQAKRKTADCRAILTKRIIFPYLRSTTTKRLAMTAPLFTHPPAPL
jgi:hypothetical protein